MAVNAFIFARGGSKRVPNKNLRRINGTSLLGHAIRCALDAKLVDHVYVSTDSMEIRLEARKYGAQIIWRSHELTHDTADQFLSWKHAVEETDMQPNDIFVALSPTTPLRTPLDIDIAIEGIKAGYSIAFAVKMAKEHQFVRTSDGPLMLFDHYNKFAVAGSCYAATPQYIRHQNNIWASKPYFVHIPEERGIDIDTEFDLKLARLLMVPL